MTHRRTRNNCLASALTITSAMLVLGVGSATVFAQDESASEPASEPSTERATAPRDEFVNRLRLRVEQLDAMRAHMVSAVERLESGTEPDELFSPEERRWLGRALRGPGGDTDDWGGWFDHPAMGPEGRRPGLGDRPDSRAREHAGQSGNLRPDGREGPDGMGREPGRERPPPLTDDQLGQIREIIDEHIPTLSERLEAVKDKDPEAAQRFLSRIAPRFRDILDLRERAPELVEVRIDELRTGMAIVAAARDLRRLHGEDSESDEVESKKREIHQLLERQFDLRQQLERDRIERQLEDLSAARERLDEQARDRDRLIEGHLSRVLSRTLDGSRGDGEGEQRRRRNRDTPDERDD